MSPSPLFETIESLGCSVALRRVQGPEARELFLGLQPAADTSDAGEQAEAMYRALLEVLAAEGGNFDAVVSETVFLRAPDSIIAAFRAARQRVLGPLEGITQRLPTMEIVQAPLSDGACLEMSVQAVFTQALPQALSPLQMITTESACDCRECARPQGLRIHVGGEARFYAGAICGAGDNAYQQTLGMFGLAEALLERAGMQFGDVVRAWIHLREMERDYSELNRARREFFASRSIEPVPASTGIEGGPVSDKHDLCLSIYAVKAGHPPLRTVMSSPTLNEAGEYGADFVRGMRMLEANKTALHISGTASIDEEGRTAHVGDLDAQADRMLINVAALLQQQEASFGDVVSAITYVKHPADAPRLREKFLAAGYVGFPNIMVAAEVCRPDLLCETEALAVLPRST